MFKEGKERIESYIERDPVLKSFFQNDKNHKLFKNYLNNPVPKNKEKVDQAFKQYYFDIKFVSYISKTLHFSAINYDKRNNIYIRRYQPQEDTDLERQVNKEVTPMSNQGSKRGDISDAISDFALFKAYNSLTDNQKKVLNLYYLYELNNVEISFILKKTPQNISKMHRTALNKIKNRLKVG